MVCSLHLDRWRRTAVLLVKHCDPAMPRVRPTRILAVCMRCVPADTCGAPSVDTCRFARRRTSSAAGPGHGQSALRGSRSLGCAVAVLSDEAIDSIGHLRGTQPVWAAPFLEQFDVPRVVIGAGDAQSEEVALGSRG